MPAYILYIYLYPSISIYIFIFGILLPPLPWPAVDDVVAHCLPTRWRTIVNNRNTAAAAVIRMLRRAACNVRHRRSGPGEGRGIGGGTRNHFKIRNSCCLFEKLLAQRTQQKETREQKEKRKEERRELFRAAFVFLPNRKLGKCTAKKYAK